MKSKKKTGNSKPEITLSKKNLPLSGKLPVVKLQEVQKLVELLKIHQVELEHQNQELRITQQELEESRNKYVNLFDFSPIPYFTLDPKGIIKEVNLSAGRMFGVDRKNLMGKNLITYIHRNDRVIFSSFTRSLFNSFEKQTCELRILNKAKQLFLVMLEGVMLADIIEQSQRCQIALIDLTGHRKIEDDLHKANVELELLNAHKDKFFSIIAHDLSSPFQGLLGITQIISEDNRLSTPEENEELYKSAFRLYKLLSNLLEWSQMKRGEINFSPESLKLSSIIFQNIELIKPTAVLKNISISTQIPESARIYADENMINSIIRNLLSNAVKFTRESGKVLVSAREINKMLEISVSDNGVGMSEEDIQRLFKINEKVSSEGTQGELGSGLGLLLCNEFVEKNGGRIRVESNAGKGSKFIFTLSKPA